MNRPVYQDKAWLQSKYDEVRSIYAMAEIAGCHARTIHYWMRKYGIRMHGMTGENKSEESIRKSVEARKGKPGSMTGKHHSDETKRRMSETRRGKDNPNWKGGITEKIRKFRRSKEYMAWVKAVYQKAGGKCEMCGAEDGLEAHHIVSLHQDFSRALDVGNGQLLCNECHKRIHGGENCE